jgi:lysophospholipase L1-like esterase
MRFLFVGDSMTIGRTGETTWRHGMARHLGECPACRRSAGSATVVGPWTRQYDDDAEHTGAGAVPDAARGEAAAPGAGPVVRQPHLAAWGEGWLHMASRIRAAVGAHRPDVLLVSLGLIDLGFYTGSAETDANVRRFFAEARAAAPRIRAVVMPVIPNIRAETDELFAAEVSRFNERLTRTLAELSLPLSPLVQAPPPTAPPLAYDIQRDTYDGTHPSPSGARKLAAAFVHALHAAAAPATAAVAVPAGAASSVPRQPA